MQQKIDSSDFGCARRPEQGQLETWFPDIGKANCRQLHLRLELSKAVFKDTFFGNCSCWGFTLGQ